MKKGKFIKTLTVFGACLGAPLLLTGCQSGDNDLLEFRVEDGYVQYTKDGKTWENIASAEDLRGADGIDGANGLDGADGNGIKSITIDQANSNATKTTYIITFDDNTTYSFEVINGVNGEDGEDGADGTDGQDGNGIKSITIDQANSDEIKTTYIITFVDNTTYSYVVKNGTNGKDGEDGEDGVDGSVVTIGEDGFWYIDGVKTDVMAKGKNGTDGLTPYIGDNGNWWIGETDTSVVAQKDDIKITLKYDSSLRFSDETIDSTMINRYNYQSELICPYGESLTLPLPTNVFGYEFEGWYSTTGGVITANDAKITNMTVFTKDITLVPKFKGYEANHEITADGVKYSYTNYTSVNKITFVEQDKGVLKIPYGTTSVHLTESSVFAQDNYTLTIPDTIFDDVNLLFYDDVMNYETMEETNLISKKVKILNIECENETSEFELTNCYPFTNISEVHVDGIVTQVYVETFKNYINLTTVKDSTSNTAGSGVELNKCFYIGISAFENTNINTVEFDFDCEKTCYIGEKAFKNCLNLVNVILENRSNTAIQTSSDIFYGCSKLMMVGVKNVNVDITLPASEFTNLQWNKYTGVHPGTLLESDVKTIQKNQEYVIYENETVS